MKGLIFLTRFKGLKEVASKQTRLTISVSNDVSAARFLHAKSHHISQKCPLAKEIERGEEDF